MRVGIVGAHGQLGTALQAALIGHTVEALGHDEIELANPRSVSAALKALTLDCLVNAAAYNLVDQAEDEPQVAQRVNAIGPKLLAAHCQAERIPLVHVSSDYVFGADASHCRPYRETDLPGPLGEYAHSKLSGEEAVRAHCERHFIVRTCGLYGRAKSAGKGNFVKTMLRLSTQKSELSIVNDQHCTPSSAADVADAIMRLIETEAYGLYHATNSGSTTWYDFACAIFRLAGRQTVVKPIPSSAYPQKAKRPAYSVLDCSKIAGVIGGPLATWQSGLERYLNEIREG